MFGLFKKNPAKALKKELAAKREEAMRVQRSGDLRAYAELVQEIEEMENKILALNK